MPTLPNIPGFENSLPPAGNFLTYVRERRDTFDERPLCAVDSLVFSWLSYFRLPVVLEHACSDAGIALHELLRAEDFDEMFGSSWDPDNSRELIFACCASPRFRDVRLTRLVFSTNKATEEQFAAMTFVLPNDTVYIAFRGTDSTIVGWKEDFNMAFMCPVPSQESARAYVEHIARETHGPLFLGGHSKGGNLAVYAAATACEGVQRRIAAVFSHDGPGLNDEFRRSTGYARIASRIKKMVPKSSIVGLIMDDGSSADVIESSGVSIFQHNPFLWEVRGCDFVPADGLTAGARYLSSTVASWMERFTPEERGRFIDTLFDVIGVTGANHFGAIREDWRRDFPAMRAAAEALEPEQRAFVLEVIRAFAHVATIGRVSGKAADVTAAIRERAGTSSRDDAR